LRAESLPKAAFPGARLWGFAIVTSGRGKVGEGFDPDAKRGRVEIVCEMQGGGRMLREACPISWSEPSSFYRHLPTTLILVTRHHSLHSPHD